jgi:hypothetical protein
MDPVACGASRLGCRAVQVLRTFVRDNPVLAQVTFSRPFADFDPGPAELEAGAVTREFIVHRVRRCIDAGIIDGDQVDIAHEILALAQGWPRRNPPGGSVPPGRR